MNRFARRGLIGMAAGLLASAALVFTLRQALLGAGLGTTFGVAFSASLPPTRGTYVDNLMGAGALGVPLWGVVSVIAFSGLLAWIMWRGIYLAKLPGLERKIRVLMDWTVELFFPRDIVQTIDLK